MGGKHADFYRFMPPGVRVLSLRVGAKRRTRIKLKSRHSQIASALHNTESRSGLQESKACTQHATWLTYTHQSTPNPHLSS